MQFSEFVWDVRVEKRTVQDGAQVPEVAARRFRTYDAAVNYAQNRIRELDLKPCIGALRNDEGWEYRNAMADFLEKLIESGCVLASKHDIPPLSKEKYAVPDYHGFRIKGDDPAPPLAVTVNATGTHIKFSYEYGPRYVIETDILMQGTHEEQRGSFCFQYACSRVSELPKEACAFYLVKLVGRRAKNTADNAVQIVELLRQSEVPLTQMQIASIIGMDRRTAGHHINKMIAEGTYHIQRAGKRGYYIEEKESVLSYQDIQMLKESVRRNPALKADEKERLLERLSKL